MKSQAIIQIEGVWGSGGGKAPALPIRGLERSKKREKSQFQGGEKGWHDEPV